MDVILLERVAKLGQMGEVVTVKDGYARNYLLPQKKALWASKSNIAAFEAQKAELEKRNEETKVDADKVAADLDGQKFVILRAASDAGALYGSVSTRDAADAMTEKGFAGIERRMVALTAPIKELGLHDVTVTLHPEVQATVTLNVARTVEEAEIQAEGKSIQQLAAEEEAQAEFEIQELFDDIGASQLDDDEGEARPEASEEPAADESDA